MGDEFRDQIETGGHARRLEDLDDLASLGAKAVRYPVLWERTAPDEPGACDWNWSDERLERIRELGVRPIVGLLHHGSGPRYTSLIDPEFPEKLAEYARSVAKRYPWVEMWTPVNEPLTTARFSCLYGHWYPHTRDDLTFSQALLNQCRATVLAMRAIREVIPDAKLVQTEDLGKTHSTPELAYQARYENERRWASLDLLTGRLSPRKAMWRFMAKAGVEERELAWFLENPCPPDVVGINHYMTSERYLDHRLDRYPEHVIGSNGKHRYADVEAVRVRAQGLAGPKALLREAWIRYGLPLAVTECHLGCTRDEQMRWLMEVWNAASELRAEGVDFRAVTVWSLQGAFDWNTLLTQSNRHYEPGAFDLRAPKPRPTGIVRMAKQLAAGELPDHPVLDTSGWWKRPCRLLYPRASVIPTVRVPHGTVKEGPRPLLITGETGTLGRAFARLCEERGLAYVLVNRQQLDIACPESVAAALDLIEPWAVINTAGYVRVDDAEEDCDRCLRENASGPALLAAACAAREIELVTFSSDLVFDGSKRSPYLESDPVSPLNVYGESKAQAERLVLKAHPGAMVVRTSAFFGPWDEHNFVHHALRALSEGRTFAADESYVVSPTYVPDLVHTCLDLLIDGERGLWHLANRGEVSWAEFARLAARVSGLDASLVKGVPTEEMGLAARRPAYSAMASERAWIMPELERAMERYLTQCEVPWQVGCLERPNAMLL